MVKEFIEEGFEELAQHGVVSKYIQIKHQEDGKSYIKPLINIDWVKENGYSLRGQKVVFIDRNGYDSELASFRDKGNKRGDIFTIKEVSIGGSSSSYTFEEIDGSYNTVMFKPFSGVEVLPVDEDAAAKHHGYSSWDDAMDYRNALTEKEKVYNLAELLAKHRNGKS